MISGILRTPGPALVVVGPYTEPLMKDLVSTFSGDLHSRVFFTGMVPQMELTRYIDQAIGSVVLYDWKSPNSMYCAPNRMYQALCRGIPVLVGANPPMKRVVEKFQNGVALEDDGRNEEMLHLALGIFLEQIGDLRDKAQLHKDEFLWESQDQVFDTILGNDLT